MNCSIFVNSLAITVSSDTAQSLMDDIQNNTTGQVLMLDIIDSITGLEYKIPSSSIANISLIANTNTPSAS